MIEVGPMPTPQTEEPERFPGGSRRARRPVALRRDPGRPDGGRPAHDKNPVTAGADDRVPDAITEPDDEKSQEPTPEEEASDEPETPV